jgi:hypothetical protein
MHLQKPLSHVPSESEETWQVIGGFIDYKQHRIRKRNDSSMLKMIMNQESSRNI